MKLTPFILFLILLFILVISILFSKFLPLNNSKEGFISFNKNKNPLDYVYIPQYSSSSNTVVKLYDNLFFDTKNSNVIEVDGSAFVDGNVTVVGNSSISSQTNLDNSGISISGVYVITRDGSINQSPYTTVKNDNNEIQPNNTKESQVLNISSKYNSWIYNTKSTQTDNYQLFFIGWHTDTYVHIINTTTSRHILSCMFSSNNLMKIHNYPNNLSLSIGNYTPDNNIQNNTLIQIPQYDERDILYQISSSVKFDYSNANLVITNNNNQIITVYNRSGNAITDYNTNKQRNIPNSDFNPFIISDSANNMVLYMPSRQNTLIAIIYLDPNNNKLFKLGNITRFTPNGIDYGLNNPNTQGGYNYPNWFNGPNGPNWFNGPNLNIGPPSNNGVSDTYQATSEYYKWLAYWNTSTNYPYNNMFGGVNNQPTQNFNRSHDYLLKTQIVPPVCPTCPSCNNSSGVCTSCGGQGGCGTKTKDGESIIKTNTDSNNRNLGIADATTNIANTGGNVLNNAVNTTGGVINNAVNNITDLGLGAEVLVGGAGLGAYDIVKSTGSGTSDLLKSAGSGTTDLIKSAGSGTSDLLKSTGSGVLSLGKDQGGYQGSYQVNSPGTYQGSSQVNSQGGSQVSSQGSSQVNSRGASQVSSPVGYSNDYYSYYGALPSNRNSNFMPVTADFSAFSK